MRGRKSWGELSEGFWKGAHLYLRSKLSASEMSLKGKETNAVALIKKSGPDQWAPSDCSACNFGRVQKNDAIIVIQLHGNRVNTLHPYPTPNSLPLLPQHHQYEPVGNVFLRSCAPIWSWKCEDWMYHCFEVKIYTFEKGRLSPKSVARRSKTNVTLLRRKDRTLWTPNLHMPFLMSTRKWREHHCSMSHSAMWSLYPFLFFWAFL